MTYALVSILYVIVLAISLDLWIQEKIESLIPSVLIILFLPTILFTLLTTLEAN